VQHFSDIDVLEFSDMICKSLISWTKRQNKRLATISGSDMENTGILERICDKLGDTRFKVTDKQSRRGRNVGKSFHLNCFICRKYLTEDGEVWYVQTNFRCSQCLMPLCKKDRSTPDIGRNLSCVDEHITSKCKLVGCFASHRQYTTFPKDKQVQLVLRCQTRLRAQAAA
jgi:hypothetical protein